MFTEAYGELVAVDREGTSAVVINKVTAYPGLTHVVRVQKSFIPWHMKLGTL
jgi:hypothetical protein